MSSTQSRGQSARLAGAQAVTAVNLPVPGAKWTPRRKAQIVAAVHAGVLDLEEACDRYTLTVDEFLGWQEAVDQEGLAGLSVRRRQERRRAARRTVNEPGEIRWNPLSTVPCSIADIGSGGARLEFEFPVRLPDEFELHCRKSGRAVWVRLVWRRDQAAGVCFETAIPIPLMQDSRWGEWLLGEC